MKLYKLLNALWSLTNHENRKYFTFALREYMDGVKQSQLLSTASGSPYKVESQHSGINPRILLVVPEFSRTGVPYAVLYLAQALYTLHGVKPAIIASKDGPLREVFEQEGFHTIVDPLLFSYRNFSSEACDFVASFDRVIVTSIVSVNFIRYFRGIGNRLTWWIHETDAGFSAAANMNFELPLMFAACETIWLGSPLCLPFALRYASQDKLHLLLYGCPDTALPHHPHKTGKIVFSIIGTVEHRKGQDVFVDAVERLPDELRRKAIFRIIGSPVPSVTGLTFYKKMCAKAARIPEAECIKNMPFDELQEFYAEANVFVCASRDDPMPIVITQGLMYSRVCLCSSAIGHVQLLADKKDGLIFTSDSAEALAEKMAWILQNPGELAALGIAGRAVYEKYFLMSSFVKNVGNLIQNGR